MGVQTFHWSWFSLVKHGFGAGLFTGFGSVPAYRRCVVVILLILLILVLTEYFISSCLFTGFTFFCLFLFNSVLKWNFRFENFIQLHKNARTSVMQSYLQQRVLSKLHISWLPTTIHWISSLLLNIVYLPFLLFPACHFQLFILTLFVLFFFAFDLHLYKLFFFSVQFFFQWLSIQRYKIFTFKCQTNSKIFLTSHYNPT